jgi:hypothetical protein
MSDQDAPDYNAAIKDDGQESESRESFSIASLVALHVYCKSILFFGCQRRRMGHTGKQANEDAWDF